MVILSLGGNFPGIYTIYSPGGFYSSPEFGDLTMEKDYAGFEKSVKSAVKKYRPDFILTDLHPLYNSVILGEKLAKKLHISLFKIQHHWAHIFSVLGEETASGGKLPPYFIGIAADGTGYGTDGKIWGGEIFQISLKDKKIKRFAALEDQILLGGELAIQEPARMLISIMLKNNYSPEIIFPFVKKYYSRNQFNVLAEQFRQRYNCPESSGTARVLDAVSLMLGFCDNERQYKHQAAKLLEENAGLPYTDIRPIIKKDENNLLRLSTGYLFDYLLKNISRDKKRLAAAAQLYLAKGFLKLAQQAQTGKFQNAPVYFSGGLAANKIMSGYLTKNGVKTNKKLPSGDGNLSFGQIIYWSKLIQRGPKT